MRLDWSVVNKVNEISMGDGSSVFISIEKMIEITYY